LGTRADVVYSLGKHTHAVEHGAIRTRDADGEETFCVMEKQRG